MIIIMQVGATTAEVAAVVANIQLMGLSAHIIEGQERTVVAVVGDERSAVDRDTLSAMSGVERTMPVLAPYQIASREVHPSDTLVPLDGISIGKNKIAIVAGPPWVESRQQVLETASALKEAGADILYGNVFGPGFSPYVSTGLGEEGLEVLAEIRKQTGLPLIAEVNEPELVPLLAPYADVLQVSGQNMQNYPLLNAIGAAQQTILLKRGIVNTLEELLMAAEYILAHGNRRVILCEGGIRTYEAYTRNITFDVNAVPVLKAKTHLPILVDVSRASGYSDFVAAASRAAVASGADGLVIEVDYDGRRLNSDAALNLDQFAALVKNLRRVAEAVDRTI